VTPGVVDLSTALARLSWGPAAIAGLVDHGGPVAAGSVANLCVFDPEETWTVVPTSLASRARNTPYAGRGMQGRVRHTILRGEPVVVDGSATR
jgi:dihydroorotase